MKDITNIIQFWSACCDDLWRKRFQTRPHGAYEFAEIEESLLKILVINPLGQATKFFSSATLLSYLRVQYRVEVADFRQFCVPQPSGNILGRAEKVSIPISSQHGIRGLDTMGTMLGTGPYAEVNWQNGFILEPIENLGFLLLDPQQ